MEEAPMTLTREQYIQARNGDSPTAANGQHLAPVEPTVEPTAETTRACPVCGKPVEGHSRRVYCSSRCSDAARHERAKQRAEAATMLVPNPLAPAVPADGLVPLVGALLALDAAAEVVLRRDDGWQVQVRAR
jgi:predicted nucleic acid-binding Zn ribbon protein